MFERIAFVVIALGAAAAAHAQAWPAKPVRVVVAFAPGGSLDFVTRIVAERLSQDLAQPFVVENRAGASGNVGADYVAKQPADGYIVLSSADALPASAHLYKLSYDPQAGHFRNRSLASSATRRMATTSAANSARRWRRRAAQ